jgi:hypothetical protein
MKEERIEGGGCRGSGERRRERGYTIGRGQLREWKG